MDSPPSPAPHRCRAAANALLLLGAIALLGHLWIFRPASPAIEPAEARTGLLRVNQSREWEELLRGGLALPPLSFLAQVPTSGLMDYPVGSEAGALTYNARPFREVDHLGDDLNGIGGQNSDLGDPVFAVAAGLVLFAGDAKGGWGNVVILQHRDANGDFFQTFSGHLDSIAVQAGESVSRGGSVGRVGTAHGQYYAHLHFEVRKGFRLDLGGGYSPFPLNRENPETVLRAHARSDRSRLHAAPGTRGEDENGLSENHGNAGTAAVASVRTWRGSPAGTPWPLTD